MLKRIYNKVVKLFAILKSSNGGVPDKVVSFYVNGKYVGQGITNSQRIAYCNYKVTPTGTQMLKQFIMVILIMLIVQRFLVYLRLNYLSWKLKTLLRLKISL